jgi:RNA polymerase sigma factor (sigma-70 family)
MRTNEELAVLVQQGNGDAMAELIEQNMGLLNILISRYNRLCNAFVSPDDLLQAAYIALFYAAKAFDPDQGYKLSTYLHYHIKNAVHRDAFGWKNRKDPAPRIVSLDAPVKGIEDGSLTIGDSIEDETATTDMEGVQADWEREQLRACLDDCLEELPLDLAVVIRAHYYDNKTLQAIADEMQSEPAKVRALENRAMRALRVPKNDQRLRHFLDSYDDCKGYGLQSFRSRGFVSMVEVKAGTY